MKDTCSCECGASTFEVEGAPLIRGYCHCETCQEFNSAPYADITMFKAKDVTEPDDLPIDYKVYQKGGVERGKCAKCGTPTLEYFEGPGLPKIAIIPSSRFAHQEQLPDSELHIWYHRRVAEVDDQLPKYQGAMKSQMVFAGKLLWRLITS